MITTTTTAAFHHAPTSSVNININVSPSKTFNVAIVGGGITGSVAASVLTSFHKNRHRPTSYPNENEGGEGEAGKLSNDHDRLIIEPILQLQHNNQSKGEGVQINVDLFDQGRNGVGGRSSHRRRRTTQNGEDVLESSNQNDNTNMMRWDHGCQVNIHF